jgi:hypothetical protein
MTTAPPRRGRALALLATVVLLVVVVVVIVFPPGRWFSSAPPTTELRGVVGSESGDFFADPQVVDALAARGIALAPTQKSGSLEIPDLGDLGTYDFAMPSSSPAADKLLRDRNIQTADSPFFSPMVVATYQPVVDVLTRAGVVRPGTDGSAVLDVAALADLEARGTRWGQLPGNTVPAPTQAVLLRTTDPSDSNSAAMFLSIASYALNGQKVLTGGDDVAGVVGRLRPLECNQGYRERSSQYLFDRYLTSGIGSTPMALVYENQFRTAARDGLLKPGQVMLYPSPTVLSRYTVVPLTDAGRAVGRALTEDPALIRRAAEFGFRPSRATTEPAAAGPLPSDVVDTPTFEVLDQLVTAVGQVCR